MLELKEKELTLDLKSKFLNLTTEQELADLLQLNLGDLYAYLYRTKLKAYHEFKIKKRRGGYRVIKEPQPGLKLAQKRLNFILKDFCLQRNCVHGFTEEKSIATNARCHEGQKSILNLDIKDFFDSINFGRVRGLFLNAPFYFSEKIATLLAQICCHENKLPQGAPTSPVISNFICYKLDKQLERLAKKYNCQYSRFADDITISSSKLSFPSRIAHLAPSGEIILNRYLRDIFKQNGFVINEEKNKLFSANRRLQVTGLTVNEKVNVPRKYVRQIRAMLHALEKYGEEAALNDYLLKYRNKDGNPAFTACTFTKALKGKLDFLTMVRGYDDPLCLKLLEKYQQLNPSYKLPQPGTKSNHLLDTEDGIFVLESFDETTGKVSRRGTAFYLQDYGLVTCAHLLKGTDNFIFKYKYPEAKFKVQVLHLNKKIDLALLSFGCLEQPKHYKFFRNSKLVRIGEAVKLLGFSKWQPGKTFTQENGFVLKQKLREGIYQIVVSCPTLPGMSGSPVFNQSGKVIGIARCDKKVTDINDSCQVIPVELLDDELLKV